MVRDLRWLLCAGDEGEIEALAEQDSDGGENHVGLWDEREGEVAAGVSYG